MAIANSLETRDFENQSFTLITAIVVILHFLFFWMLTMQYSPTNLIPKKKELVVKTVQLQKNPIIEQKKIAEPVAKEQPKEIDTVNKIEFSSSIEEPKVELKELPQPLPEKKEIPKKELPKKKTAQKTEKKKEKKPTPKTKKSDTKPKKEKTTIQKKEVSKKNPPAKTESKEALAAKAKQKELIKNAQKSMAKVSHLASTTSLIPTTNLSIIDTLKFENLSSLPSEIEDWSPQEKNYYSELASRLKLLLRLPEYGEVKVKLTLSKTGNFLKSVIVNAKSKKNRDYIEKSLPSLTYPGFGNNFSNANQYTFLISLSNE